MNKSILSICLIALSVFLLTGCTFHIKYLKDVPAPEQKTSEVILDKSNKITCIVYDEAAYIDLDVRHALTRSDLAFDYGDAIKKMGEKYFYQNKNIKFLNIEENASDHVYCDFKIMPKIEEAIYRYESTSKPYRKLNITMRLKLVDNIKSTSDEQIYKSETMLIPWSIASKFNDLASTFTYWMYQQFTVAINALNKMEGK